MSDFRPDLDAIWENVYETCRNKYNEASFHVQLECSSNVVLQIPTDSRIGSCSYLYLELLSGSSRYQRLVACILGYFHLPLNLLYSNSVFSGLRGFPHSQAHVSVRVLPVGSSVSH